MEAFMPLKLTQRGRGIKDNSRRTGAGAGAFFARREGAAKRFRVMPFAEWAKSHPDASQQEYDGYIARKAVEAKALGLAD
jgi:hypothetical protein